MNIDRLARKIRYYMFDLCSPRSVAPAAVDVDVIIPVTTKDLKILPLALEGVRRCVNHHVAAIYIVARSDEGVKAFCRDHGVTFVDETSVLGYAPRDIALMAGDPPRDRSGWLFQQLLKLSGAIGSSPYFITIDADHILLRSHTFVAADGSSVFYRSKEHHAPYFDNIRRLIGRSVDDGGLSYVAHKMVFSRATLASLRDEIVSHNPGKSWDRAIIDSVDRSVTSGFSEFELYGNFVADEQKCSMPFRNHHIKASAMANYDSLRRKYAGRYAAITFPDYLR